MNVPLLDLNGQYATIKDELMPVIEAVIESCHFINGPEVARLEKVVAEYCGCKFGVGVSSGTDAILCSLMALGIGPGDEVITTPYTFFATAGSIWRTGARPAFVDIEYDTFNIDPSRIEAAVTAKTKAIMPVDLFGQMAEMDPIMEIASKHDLFVIEDAAQAIGASYKGKKAGSIPTMGCLSFYPSKNLGALGDGGMIVTQSNQLIDRLGQCRNHGQQSSYYHSWVGGNFRLDTIQAAALLVKLRHLDDWSAKRRANATIYDELFADCQAVITPTVREYNVSIYNQYVIRTANRNELQAFLKEAGVGTAIYYPLALHEQECFKELGYKRGDFPVSEKAAEETLALPIFPELTYEQIQYVAGKVKEFIA